MNRRVQLAALVLLAGFLLSSPVDAIPPARDGVVVQGPLFLDTCNDKDPLRHSACVGFIAGVANSYLNSGQTCISANTDPKEVTDFVRYYMNSNANLVNQPAVNVVVLALKARYPCTRPMLQLPPLQFRGLKWM